MKRASDSHYTTDQQESPLLLSAQAKINKNTTAYEMYSIYAIKLKLIVYNITER